MTVLLKQLIHPKHYKSKNLWTKPTNHNNQIETGGTRNFQVNQIFTSIQPSDNQDTKGRSYLELVCIKFDRELYKPSALRRNKFLNRNHARNFSGLIRFRPVRPGSIQFGSAWTGPCRLYLIWNSQTFRGVRFIGKH